MSQYEAPHRDNKLHLLLVFVAAAYLSVAEQAMAQQAAHSTETISAVHIVSQQRGSADAPSTAPKRENAEPGVEMFAVLQTTGDRGTRYYADTPRVQLGRSIVVAHPLHQAPPHTLIWYRVEPSKESMSNTQSGGFQFESISYRETIMKSGIGKGRLIADVRPTLTPDRGHGLGTMRFKLVARTPTGVTLQTPGREAKRGRGSGGLADSVHRVSLRSDDTYLGFLTEMYGQPYIWASAGMTPGTHQSERLEGSDCADFVTYGWRRMGHRVPYTWSEGLRKYTQKLGSGIADRDGVYRDGQGRALPFPRRGDLILFPRHVGVIVEDRGTIGVLDHDDILFHTLFASPRRQALGDTSYGHAPAEIHRWRPKK